MATPQLTLIAGFAVDAVLSEGHDRANDVTDFPVDRRGNSVDTIRPKPKGLTLEGFVSDTPFGEIASLRDPGSIPSAEFDAHVEKLINAQRPIRVVTALRDYPSLAIETSSLKPEDGGIAFSFTFREVQIRDVDRITIVIPARLKPKSTKGIKPTLATAPNGTAPPQSAGQQKKSSALAQMVYHGKAPNNLFGLF